MGSMPTQYREEFGLVLICSGNSGSDSKQRPENQTCRPYISPKRVRSSFTFVCVRSAAGWRALSSMDSRARKIHG